MVDISGFGLVITLTASVTFPNGINITQLADNIDPLGIGALPIGDAASGLNGDKADWRTVEPIEVTLGVIPNGEDDINLEILGEANRAGRGKSVANDVIQLIGNYPNGSTVTYTGGTITSFTPGDSVSSEGRLDSKAYIFKFENRTRTR